MQRWMHRAAGGTSQRLKPGLAMIRSRERSAGEVSPAVCAGGRHDAFSPHPNERHALQETPLSNISATALPSRSMCLERATDRDGIGRGADRAAERAAQKNRAIGCAERLRVPCGAHAEKSSST